MYPRVHAEQHPERAAYVMAGTGQVVTYGELEAESNRFARYFRDAGLQIGDHIAVLLRNHPRYLQVTWAALRSGLYYTPINWHLTPAEVDHIVQDCGARVLVTSEVFAGQAARLVGTSKRLDRVLVVDGPLDGLDDYETDVLPRSVLPIGDEATGYDMIYSSGTTGLPKGGKQPLPNRPPGEIDERSLGFFGLFGLDDRSTYLMPGAPMYHAAPLRFTTAVTRLGGTAVLMERFDPLQALSAIETYGVTHSQWVPTMFVRMLRLPIDERDRFDLSSHEVAIHAAAPCAVWVKREMIDWWGPIVHEYYGASEGGGLTYIGSHEWLEHPGSVGKPAVGTFHVLDDDGNELPPGQSGVLYVEGGIDVEYHRDGSKTAAAHSPRGWVTVGDMGYLDADGYLYLTDRKDFMIISGGVNIYPRECEDVLSQHPEVADVAIFGVPNEDLGEEVKAVVEPVHPERAGPELAAELIAHCKDHLAGYKVPRSVDFEAELPRAPSGKLYKRRLRDRYWSTSDTGVRA